MNPGPEWHRWQTNPKEFAPHFSIDLRGEFLTASVSSGRRTAMTNNALNGNGKIHNGIHNAINDTQETCGFIEELVGKCANNPGYVFAPEVIERLAYLKQEDRLTFETLRVRLKKMGFRLTALDDVIAQSTSEAEREPSHAEILMSFAEDIELFHDASGTAYADIDVNGHRETWNVRSEGFSHWISHRFFKETHKALPPETLKSSLANFEAKARFEGQEQPVFLRTGSMDDKLYIDLCNNEWEAVEIDCKGWRVINNPPVRFRRVAGMKELPVPIKGGSIDKLRGFLNVGSDGDFVLAVSWILAALRSHGPYPILVLNGEMGSSKSTFSNILKSLVDPSASSIRTLPRKDTDLFISASNSYVLAFDNISALSNSVSDSLCRLSTGGSHVARELFTNQREIAFSATRPMILNGIEEFVNRSDLADRSLFITLEAIPEDKRRAEAEFWKSFEAERPYILGALLDGMVEGLRNINEIKLPKLPRLADFALWAAACEGVYWKQGTFVSAFNDNRDDVIEHVIEADPLADTLRSFITKQPNSEWEGRACELLNALTDNGRNKPRQFPNSPHTLSGHLRRVSTFLRKLGIEIEFERRDGKRIIYIRATADNETEATRATGAIKPSVMDGKNQQFSSSLVANNASKSSLPENAKDMLPVISCRFEGTVSIQPDTSYHDDNLQRAGKWKWFERIKRAFAGTGC